MAAGFKSLLAFWLGRVGAVPTTPVTVTDVRMGQMTTRSGLLSLRMNSGTVEFVIT